MEIINGVNNQNILCESKNDYGNFYILSRNSRGDAQSNTQKIIFLAGKMDGWEVCCKEWWFDFSFLRAAAIS